LFNLIFSYLFFHCLQDTYLLHLSSILASGNVDNRIRQAAGIALKNAFVSKDAKVREKLAVRWSLIDENIRSEIRGRVQRIMDDETKSVRNTAGLVCGEIAVVEIPKGVWMELPSELCTIIADSNKSPNLRESSLFTLQVIAEAEVTDLSSISSNMLEAVHSATNTGNELQVAGIACLSSILKYVKADFAKVGARKSIMEMIFSAINSGNDKSVVGGLGCLIAVAENCYEYLEDHADAIMELSIQIMGSGETELQTLAIEVWNTICEDEIDRVEDAQYDSSVKVLNYNELAVAKFLPIILEAMTQQDEDDSREDWTTPRAAAVCVGNICLASGDPAADVIFQFVSANISSEDWHHREAATLAFGYMLDGPSKDKMVSICTNALETLIKYTGDPHPMVRETAMWVIARITDVLPESMFGDGIPNDKKKQIFNELMEIFARGLSKDSAVVASYVCFAFSVLADVEEAHRPLQEVLFPVIKALLDAAERPDSDQGDLGSSSYAAINSLIMNICTSGKDAKIADELMPILGERLKNSLKKAGGQEVSERQMYAEIVLQGELCGALQLCVEKMSQQCVEKSSESLMFLFLHILNSEHGSLTEEALLAVTAIAQRIGDKFIKYMQEVVGTILNGIAMWDQKAICIMSAESAGELARACGDQIAKVSDEIMKALFNSLNQSEIDRLVHPHLISAMGDIVLALGANSTRYFRPVMEVLTKASTVKCDDPDEEDIEYLDELRAAILFVYQSFLQSLNTSVGQMNEFLPSISNFFILIATNVRDNPDANFKSSMLNVAGLFIDIFDALPDQVVKFKGHQGLHFILEKCSKLRDQLASSQGGNALRYFNNL